MKMLRVTVHAVFFFFLSFFKKCCYFMGDCSLTYLVYWLMFCSELIKKIKCKKNILSVLSIAIMSDPSDMGLTAMPDL